MFRALVDLCRVRLLAGDIDRIAAECFGRAQR
jgi:hypothetical protein